MDINDVQKQLDDYFREKLVTYGATAKGVDYNSDHAQQNRFAQLAKIIDPNFSFSILDYGSGYGAFFDFLNNFSWEFEYYGIDKIEEMVAAGKELHKQFPNAHFTTSEKELPQIDYAVGGAIFNIKLDASYDEWQESVIKTLHLMDVLSSKGFAFNMLTKYSDFDRMEQRPDLFYGDPCYFFDYCKRNFSRNVALLHDYGLYDFTILVRKDSD